MYVETCQKIYVFGYVYFVLWPSRFHVHGHLTVLYACSNIPALLTQILLMHLA